MTVNDPRLLRVALVRAFYRDPHVQTVPRWWDEKNEYSHFAVLHCALHPVMPSADYSPLTERSQVCLPAAVRGTLRASLGVAMESQCL